MEKSSIHRIGILTSGGDAPGMNSAICAIVRNCMNHDIEPIGVYRGYNGLINGDFEPLDLDFVKRISSQGGTALYTARCDEFKTEAGQKRAVDTCRYAGIDGMICIGGDGTFRGVQALSALGIKSIGIPGTIDNDIPCTHYSIGFDTAANTAIDAIDKLSDTMRSHERISIVEVMGRHAGHLALYCGLAAGATAVLIPEEPFSLDDVIERIRASRLRGKHHFVVIVAEGVGGTQEIAQQISENTGIEARVTIIGHIQRGGRPSVRDRVMGSRMGHYAVEQLVAGQSDVVICYRDSHICALPMAEAFTITKQLDEYMYRVAQDVGM